MFKYRVNICGCVEDTDTDFKCGFEFSVENGGSVGNIGKSIQDAIDGMKGKGHPIEKSASEKPKEE